MHDAGSGVFGCRLVSSYTSLDLLPVSHDKSKRNGKLASCMCLSISSCVEASLWNNFNESQNKTGMISGHL